MSNITIHKITSSAEKKLPCFKCKKHYFENEMNAFKVPSSWGSVRGLINVCTVTHQCRMYADWMKMQKFTKI